MPGRDGERIAAERARLVNRPERGELVEQRRRGRRARPGACPPPSTLPKVTRSGVHPAPSGTTRAASRPHQPAGPTRNPVSTSSRISRAPFSRAIVASARLNPRAGREHARVGSRRLGDDRGDPARMRGECRSHRVEIVVRQHEGEGRDRGGNPGRAGQAEGRDPGSGLGEQPVGVPVVVPGELDEQVAAGHPARQPDRGHRRLGARRDQAELVDAAGSRRRRGGCAPVRPARSRPASTHRS